ncbi:MAG: hypothetical protein EDX89_05430 [Acidobacteria bacterium]|nr:MAG: hypothetical protein EDX89_05430 [Acidobacteriota bacterium]MCE7956783.1 hypothetical protein [Acidobacteria bacterium ACB2]
MKSRTRQSTSVRRALHAIAAVVTSVSLSSAAQAGGQTRASACLLLVVDGSGSARGQAIGTPTDSMGLRQQVLGELARQPIVDSAGRPATAAAVSSTSEPYVLLEPSADPAVIGRALTTPMRPDSGGNNLIWTFGLFSTLPPCEKTNIVYIGDGLVESGKTRSEDVVRQLPALASRQAPALGGATWAAVLTDTTAGRSIAGRTEREWFAITDGKVFDVSGPADVGPAVNALLETFGLGRRRPVPPTPRARVSPVPAGVWLGLAALVVLLAASRLRRRDLPRATVLIKTAAGTRRVEVSKVGKPSVTVGAAGADIRVPGASGPPLLFSTRADGLRKGKRITTVTHGGATTTVGPRPIEIDMGGTKVSARKGV